MFERHLVDILCAGYTASYLEVFANLIFCLQKKSEIEFHGYY